jgi:tetratricopeptide (TPR) repeat protein
MLLISMTGVSASLGQEDIPTIIRRVEPSTVVIVIYDKEGRVKGQGTGFFISKEGDVISNFHVIQGADRAEVRTTDGKAYPVTRVLDDDRMGDLIRISTNTLGNLTAPLSVVGSFPEVGTHVIVIGTPLGLEKTVSDGIVSAVREIPGFGKIIQLTAPISPGSSGSPVLNMKGEVVGIISFFVAPGQNLNFAIPGERILRLTPGEGRSLSEWGLLRKEERISQAEDFYALGLQQLLQEDWERALVFFTESADRNPDNADTYFQVAYCNAKLGKYLEAVGFYKEAIRMKPRDEEAYTNLCGAYNMLGNFKEAIESCQQAIQIRWDVAGAHNNLAWSYHKLGRYTEAIESSQQAIKIKPDYALAHFNLGNNYQALGRYSEAIASYKQAIRFNPDHAESHLNLGAAYHQTGKYEEAAESYKQSIRIKPDLVEAHLNLGMTYLRLGDRGSALEEYKILLQLNKETANKLFNLIYE